MRESFMDHFSPNYQNKEEENSKMISTGQVTGRWKNSKSTTKCIAGFTLEDGGNGLVLSIRGADDGYLPSTIGPISAVAHASNMSSTDCIAFHAVAEVDGKEYFFAGNVNKGLIIIATYVKVSSGKDSNFFVREFFYKLK